MGRTQQLSRWLLSKASVIWRKLRSLFPASHYVLLALIYVVGLELLFALQRWVFLVVIAVITVVTIGVVLVSYEEKGRFSLSNILLPILATIGLTGFAFFLPTSIVLHLYIATAGFVLFFLLKHGARKAYPIWNWLISLLIFFLNIAFVTGLRFHLYTPIIAILFAIFLISALISWQSLRRIASGSEIVVPVLMMAFALTEIAWTLQFMPSHYLLQAGILTSIYYIMFNLVGVSLKRKPLKQDIYEYLSVGLVGIIILLITARWV
jgi:hypothetical protein